jgi:hypothetical protein
MREHLLARAPYATVDNQIVGPDLGAVLRRLLLFESFALESDMLDEVAGLARAVGVDVVVELLAEGHLALIIEAGGVGPGFSSDDPPLSFKLRTVLNPQAQSDAIENLHGRLDLPQRSWSRLEDAVLGAILVPTEVVPGAWVNRVYFDAREATSADLDRRGGLVEDIVRIVLRYDLGVGHGTELPFRLNWSRVAGLLMFETDIGTRYGIREGLVQDLLHRSLRALSTLNIRLVQAAAFDRMVAFGYRDTSLIEAKYSVLLRDVDPDIVESSFTRVVDIVGLPDIAHDASNVDGAAFLRLCRSREAAEFRTWLRDLPGRDDEDVRAELTSKATRIGAALGTSTGRRARFAITTALGFVPVVGSIVGSAASAVDSFWLDELANGAVWLVTSGYGGAVDAQRTTGQ